MPTLLVVSLLCGAVHQPRPAARAAMSTVRMAAVAPAASAPGTATPPPAEMSVCPETIWGATLDIAEAQRAVRGRLEAEYPRELQATRVLDSGAVGDVDAEVAFFKENAASLREQMLEDGAIVLRGFSLMRTPEGFQRMYEALDLEPCLDPLHSVSARPMVDKNSAVYEAVNKESRKNFFIGTGALVPLGVG